jgi:hypothetical protein
MNGRVVEAGAWTERLPAIPVPASCMIGNPSRFTNIYIPQAETILLEEGAIESQDITLRVRHGLTKTLHDYTSDTNEARQGGIGAFLRVTAERAFDGPVLKMGRRLVYDARWAYNGNLAHLVGHHLGRLGYAKAKLGIGRQDCIVILEKNSPKISHALFSMLGYETYETNRAVEAMILEVDVKRYEPYLLAPYVAYVEPEGMPPGGETHIFISRRSSRRLINEREIVEIAEARGFRTYYFEAIPLEKQWSLVRDAHSIVSIHGAALGYLCTKGMPAGAAPSCSLLEIFSPGLVADIFRKTIAAVGGRWVGCRGRLTSDFVKYVDERKNFRTQEAKDFYLHPEALDRAFTALARQ